MYVSFWSGTDLLLCLSVLYKKMYYNGNNVHSIDDE